MNPRNQILKDTDFWLELEFGLFLQPEKKEKIPLYWIDGFIPEQVTNTKSGIVVEGKVWIVEGKNPGSFTFELSVPQKLLHKKIKNFETEVIEFSPEKKFLRLEVKPKKREQNQAAHTTPAIAPR